MKTIYIYHPQTSSYGVMVIINRLVTSCLRRGVDCKYITTLDNICRDSFVIPYGIIASIEVIRKGFVPKLTLLADAYTFGELNKVKFYISNLYFGYYDLYYSLYSYLRYVGKEREIIKRYQRIMLVSEKDISYFVNRWNVDKKKFICIPNGMEMHNVTPKIKSNRLRLGLMAGWTRVSYNENLWFVEDYYTKFIETHPNVELIIAGRGEFATRFAKYPQVRCLGEIDDLNRFFENIDVFLSLNPKGCGILNRVLDAFSYKTVVIGLPASFSGFSDMKKSFLTFYDYESFVKCIDEINNNPDKQADLIFNAYSQSKELYNWDRNNDKLIDLMVELSNEG